MNLKLVGFVALCGAVAIACGDTSSSGGGGSTAANNNGGNNNNNGGGGSTSVVNPEGGTINIGGSGQGGGGDVPACYDETAAGTDTSITQGAVGLDQCTTQQVTDFLAACFAPGTMQTCTDYLTANAACGGCIFGVEDPNAATPTFTGNVPPILQGQMYAFVQTLACEAMVQNLPDCAVPLTNLVLCSQLACEVNCSNDAGSTEFSDCVNYAATAGICGTTVTVPAECDPILMQQTPSPECDGADFDTLFTNVADYFCGPPAG